METTDFLALPLMTSAHIYKNAPEYYHEYFDRIETNDLLAELEKSREHTLELFDTLPAEKEDFAYESGKWTVKEVLLHLMDVERVLAYRALRFSRFDPTPLPGMNEDMYISHLRPVNRSLAELKSEFESVRAATLSLFAPMTDAMLDFKGIANNHPITARAIGFIIAGHNFHHVDFIKSMYL